MPQTQAPAYRWAQGENIDYTPAADVYPGDVLFIGSQCGIAVNFIAANTLGALAIVGVFKVPKTAVAIAVGAAINWNPTGDPNTGTAGTGAANALGVGKTMGMAVLAAASTDDFVFVLLNRSGSTAVNTVAAAGSTNADAAAISSTASRSVVVATGADATKGVIMPAVAAGTVVTVKNAGAAVLKVYPFAGAAINGLTATTGGISMAANTIAEFIATSATQVYTLPLLPS